MKTDTREQMELDYIETVICNLENLNSGDEKVQTTAVLQPEYWRARIRAVLATPGISKRTARRAATLLARLSHHRDGGQR